MTQPIDPTPPIRPERRAKERRARQRRQDERRGAEPGANLPVPAGPVRAEARPGPNAEPSAPFVAQLFGQPGQKRGLKGGPVVLEAARSAYLGAEWSGPGDRRKPAGKIAKTEL